MMEHLTVPPGWTTPTVLRCEGKLPQIVSELRGYEAGGGAELVLEAEPNVTDVPQCQAMTGVFVCPLVDGHIGDHWMATRELAAEAAPIRVWAHLVG